MKDPGSASQGLYPVHGKIPNEGPTVRPSYGDGEVGDKLQCCTECLAKFEQERHRLHEHERLSLHLAPAEWCSLSSGGALNEGRLDTHSSQVRSNANTLLFLFGSRYVSLRLCLGSKVRN